MKKLLLIFILTLSFQNLIKADDITDFEIEGMSIGDSLLDFFNNEEINKALIKNYYNNLPNDFKDTYGYVEFKLLPRFEVYENVSMDFFKNDNKLINQTITGTLFIKDYQECLKKQINIDKELSLIFKNTYRDTNEKSHSADSTGNSKTRSINYWFDNDDVITLICTDWSDEITKNYGWDDNLSLEIKTNEYNKFLISAYKK